MTDFQCTWVIPLAAFGVAKTTPVSQFQRARMVNNTEYASELTFALHVRSLLLIELSSSTPEVMFGTDFSVEQLWEISKVSENKCLLNVSSGVNWINQPWGVGMVKGTIDEKSGDETKKSAAHFAALIEQSLTSAGEKKPRGTSSRRFVISCYQLLRLLDREELRTKLFGGGEPTRMIKQR